MGMQLARITAPATSSTVTDEAAHVAAWTIRY
jgi:hypothetical protein